MHRPTSLHSSGQQLAGLYAEGGSRFMTLCQTGEPDKAEQIIKEWAKDPSLSLSFERRPSAHLELRGFEFSDLKLQFLNFGSPTVGKSSKPPITWAFTYLCRGQAKYLRSGICLGAGDASMAEPGKNGDAVVSGDTTTLAVLVSQRDLDNACHALYGADFSGQLRLAERAPAGSSAAAALSRAIQRIDSTPKYPFAQAARLERSLKEAALFELLLTWPNMSPPVNPSARAMPATTSRARDYIHAHINDSPTVADVAAACGVGVRALARGFEKHLGTSPLQYMLELRLQGVHDALRAGGAGATVTDLALEWGFTHLGVFSARYRERFGELPSATLNKSRR